MCNSLDIKILKGVASKGHMYLNYPPKLSVGDVVKRLESHSSRVFLEEFPKLHRRYRGNHFYGIGYGYRSTGHSMEDMLSSYLDHHKDRPNTDDNFILE